MVSFHEHNMKSHIVFISASYSGIIAVSNTEDKGSIPLAGAI